MSTRRPTTSLPAQVALFLVPLLVATALLLLGLDLATGPRGGDTTAITPAPTTPASEPRRVEGGGTWAPTRVNMDGAVVAWPECSAIRWVHNPLGMPVGALRDVSRAMDEVSARTGLVFVHVGGTDEAPSPDRPTYQPNRYGEDPAPVLVAFVDEAGDLPLGPDDRAVTVVVAQGTPELRELVTGQVILRTDAGDVGDFTSRSRGLGAVLMHELGHLVGLNHVGDPNELMFAHPTAGAVEWGPGDLAGLAAVGSTRC